MNTATTTTRTPDPATAIVGRLLTTAVTLAAVLVAAFVAMAPGAGAAPIDDIEILDIGEIELLTPEIELDIDDLVIPTPVISTDAVVTCTDEAAVEVTIDNRTLVFAFIEISIDGDAVDFAVVPSGGEYTQSYPVEENSTAHVEMTSAVTLFDDALDVDCLSPDPWFDFIANCDVGQAWVELGNHGPDDALMGVHYTDLPHAPGLVAAGTSTIQPLAVEPNEFADFAIEVDFEPIYTDGFFFDCPEPEPQPEPEPEPEDADGEDAIADDDAETDVEDNVEDNVETDVEGGKQTDGVDGAAPTPQTPTTGDTDVPADVPTDVPADVIEGPEAGDGDAITEIGADELALAADLQTDGSSTSTSILVALLLVSGLVMVVGSATAMKLRR